MEDPDEEEIAKALEEPFEEPMEINSPGTERVLEETLAQVIDEDLEVNVDVSKLAKLATKSFSDEDDYLDLGETENIDGNSSELAPEGEISGVKPMFPVQQTHEAPPTPGREIPMEDDFPKADIKCRAASPESNVQSRSLTPKSRSVSPNKSRSVSRSKSRSPSRSKSRSKSGSPNTSRAASSNRSRSGSRNRSRSGSRNRSRSASSNRSHAASSNRSGSPNRSRSGSPNRSRSGSPNRSRAASSNRSRSGSPQSRPNSSRATRTRSNTPNSARSRSTSPKARSVSPGSHKSRSVSPGSHKSRSRSPKAGTSGIKSRDRSGSNSDRSVGAKKSKPARQMDSDSEEKPLIARLTSDSEVSDRHEKPRKKKKKSKIMSDDTADSEASSAVEKHTKKKKKKDKKKKSIKMKIKLPQKKERRRSSDRSSRTPSIEETPKILSLDIASFSASTSTLNSENSPVKKKRAPPPPVDPSLRPENGVPPEWVYNMVRSFFTERRILTASLWDKGVEQLTNGCYVLERHWTADQIAIATRLRPCIAPSLIPANYVVPRTKFTRTELTDQETKPKSHEKKRKRSQDREEKHKKHKKDKKKDKSKERASTPVEPVKVSEPESMEVTEEEVISLEASSVETPMQMDETTAPETVQSEVVLSETVQSEVVLSETVNPLLPVSDAELASLITEIVTDTIVEMDIAKPVEPVRAPSSKQERDASPEPVQAPSPVAVKVEEETAEVEKRKETPVPKKIVEAPPEKVNKKAAMQNKKANKKAEVKKEPEPKRVVPEPKPAPTFRIPKKIRSDPTPLLPDPVMPPKNVVRKLPPIPKMGPKVNLKETGVQTNPLSCLRNYDGPTVEDLMLLARTQIRENPIVLANWSKQHVMTSEEMTRLQKKYGQVEKPKMSIDAYRKHIEKRGEHRPRPGDNVNGEVKSSHRDRHQRDAEQSEDSRRFLVPKVPNKHPVPPNRASTARTPPQNSRTAAATTPTVQPPNGPSSSRTRPDSPNRRSDSPNRPGRSRNDSPNNGRRTDSPNRNRGRTDSPNNVRSRTDSPNRNRGRTDSPNRGRGRQSSPNRGGGRQNSPNRGRGRQASPKRHESPDQQRADSPMMDTAIDHGSDDDDDAISLSFNDHLSVVTTDETALQKLKTGKLKPSENNPFKSAEPRKEPQNSRGESSRDSRFVDADERPKPHIPVWAHQEPQYLQNSNYHPAGSLFRNPAGLLNNPGSLLHHAVSLHPGSLLPNPVPLLQNPIHHAPLLQHHQIPPLLPNPTLRNISPLVGGAEPRSSLLGTPPPGVSKTQNALMKIAMGNSIGIGSPSLASPGNIQSPAEHHSPNTPERQQRELMALKEMKLEEFKKKERALKHRFNLLGKESVELHQQNMLVKHRMDVEIPQEEAEYTRQMYALKVNDHYGREQYNNMIAMLQQEMRKCMQKKEELEIRHGHLTAEAKDIENQLREIIEAKGEKPVTPKEQMSTPPVERAQSSPAVEHSSPVVQHSSPARSPPLIDTKMTTFMLPQKMEDSEASPPERRTNLFEEPSPASPPVWEQSAQQLKEFKKARSKEATELVNTGYNFRLALVPETNEEKFILDTIKSQHRVPKDFASDICRNFFTNLGCPYEKCCFSHEVHNLRDIMRDMPVINSVQLYLFIRTKKYRKYYNQAFLNINDQIFKFKDPRTALIVSYELMINVPEYQDRWWTQMIGTLLSIKDSFTDDNESELKRVLIYALHHEDCDLMMRSDIAKISEKTFQYIPEVWNEIFSDTNYVMPEEVLHLMVKVLVDNKTKSWVPMALEMLVFPTNEAYWKTVQPEWVEVLMDLCTNEAVRQTLESKCVIPQMTSNVMLLPPPMPPAELLDMEKNEEDDAPYSPSQPTTGGKLKIRTDFQPAMLELLMNGQVNKEELCIMYQQFCRAIETEEWQDLVEACKAFPGKKLPRGRSLFHALKEKLHHPYIGFLRTLEAARQIAGIKNANSSNGQLHQTLQSLFGTVGINLMLELIPANKCEAAAKVFAEVQQMTKLDVSNITSYLEKPIAYNQVLLQAGGAYLKLGQHETAVEIFKQMLALPNTQYTDTIEAIEQIIDYYLTKDQFALAFQLFPAAVNRKKMYCQEHNIDYEPPKPGNDLLVGALNLQQLQLVVPLWLEMHYFPMLLQKSTVRSALCFFFNNDSQYVNSAYQAGKLNEAYNIQTPNERPRTIKMHSYWTLEEMFTVIQDFIFKMDYNPYNDSNIDDFNLFVRIEVNQDPSPPGPGVAPIPFVNSSLPAASARAIGALNRLHPPIQCLPASPNIHNIVVNPVSVRHFLRMTRNPQR